MGVAFNLVKALVNICKQYDELNSIIIQNYDEILTLKKLNG